MSRRRVYHAPLAPQVLPEESWGVVEHRAPQPPAVYRVVDGRTVEVLTPELVAWKLDRWELTHG